MEDAARILQLVVNGAASGCIYGLIALGFVLIYKATEMVNFAQGDVMMLGGFVAFSLIANFHLPYWLGAILAILITGAFGYALDALILRRVIGQPQFAVVMLTLGLGFIFRAAAGITWGYDSVGFNTPFTNKTVNVGGLVLVQTIYRSLSAPSCYVVCFTCFSQDAGGGGDAGGIAKSACCVLHGHSGSHDLLDDLGYQCRRGCVAGILLSPVSMIDVNMGFLGIKAFAAAVIGGFGSIPGCLIGGVFVGIVEQFAGYYLPAGFRK